jgi:hypothetical protein
MFFLSLPSCLICRFPHAAPRVCRARRCPFRYDLRQRRQDLAVSVADHTKLLSAAKAVHVRAQERAAASIHANAAAVVGAVTTTTTTSTTTTVSTTASTAGDSCADESGRLQAPSSSVSDVPQRHAFSEAAVAMDALGIGFPIEWCEVALDISCGDMEAAINFCLSNDQDMPRLVEEAAARRAQAVRLGAGLAPAVAQSAGASVYLPVAGASVGLVAPLMAPNDSASSAPKAPVGAESKASEGLGSARSEPSALKFPGAGSAEPGADATLATPPRAQLSSVPGEGLPLGAAFSAKGAALGLKPLPGSLSAGVLAHIVLGHDGLVENPLGAGVFPSIGFPQVMLRSGVWYYEVTVLTAGVMQIGWADASFEGSALRGNGVGDDANSWAYDGCRQYRWHGTSDSWGTLWKPGDVVGCLVDLRKSNLTMSFSINGSFAAPMGVAFRGLNFAGGLCPALSYSRGERLVVNFGSGGRPFAFPPPVPFEPVASGRRSHYNVRLHEDVPSIISSAVLAECSAAAAALVAADQRLAANSAGASAADAAEWERTVLPLVDSVDDTWDFTEDDGTAVCLSDRFFRSRSIASVPAVHLRAGTRVALPPPASCAGFAVGLGIGLALPSLSDISGLGPSVPALGAVPLVNSDAAGPEAAAAAAAAVMAAGSHLSLLESSASAVKGEEAGAMSRLLTATEAVRIVGARLVTSHLLAAWPIELGPFRVPSLNLGSDVAPLLVQFLYTISAGEGASQHQHTGSGIAGPALTATLHFGLRGSGLPPGSSSSVSVPYAGVGLNFVPRIGCEGGAVGYSAVSAAAESLNSIVASLSTAAVGKAASLAVPLSPDAQHSANLLNPPTSVPPSSSASGGGGVTMSASLDPLTTAFRTALSFGRAPGMIINGDQPTSSDVASGAALEFALLTSIVREVCAATKYGILRRAERELIGKQPASVVAAGPHQVEQATLVGGNVELAMWATARLIEASAHATVSSAAQVDLQLRLCQVRTCILLSEDLRLDVCDPLPPPSLPISLHPHVPRFEFVSVMVYWAG